MSGGSTALGLVATLVGASAAAACLYSRCGGGATKKGSSKKGSSKKKQKKGKSPALKKSALPPELRPRNRWIQAGRALEETTKVVANFVDSKFQKQHSAVLKKVAAAGRCSLCAGLASACSGQCPTAADGPSRYTRTGKKCTTTTWHACPLPLHGSSGCTACTKHRTEGCAGQAPLFAEFAQLHINGDIPKPLELNSDASKWGNPRAHVEMAKLYCPKLGEHDHAIKKTTFAELDGTALFNMLSYCKIFHEDYHGDSGFGQKAATSRNRWGHEGAARLSLTEPEHLEVFAGLRDLLQRLEQELPDGAPNPFTDARTELNKIEATDYALIDCTTELQEIFDRLTQMNKQLLEENLAQQRELAGDTAKIKRLEQKLQAFQNECDRIKDVQTWFFTQVQVDLPEHYQRREDLHDELVQWATPAKGPTSQHCLLLGNPGGGKTALLSELAGPVTKETQLGKMVLASHFCVAERTDSLKTSNFVQNIVGQLEKHEAYQSFMRTNDDFRNKVEGVRSGDAWQNLDSLTLFCECVLEPLIEIGEKKFGSQRILVVDSLDEAKSYQLGDGISSDIARLLQACTRKARFRWLRVLASSRPDTVDLPSWHSINLADPRRLATTNRYIRSYINAHLQQTGSRLLELAGVPEQNHADEQDGGGHRCR